MQRALPDGLQPQVTIRSGCGSRHGDGHGSWIGGPGANQADIDPPDPFSQAPLGDSPHLALLSCLTRLSACLSGNFRRLWVIRSYRIDVSDANALPTLAAKIDDLMSLATARDIPDRLAQLRELVTDDVQFINPGVCATGVEQLSEVFDWLSQSLPPGTKIRRTSVVDFHHDHFRYTWQRHRDGGVEAEGVDLGRATGDGRIAKIVTFDGQTLTPRGEA